VQSSRGKILVIRGGAIGDFVLTLPALMALRSRFPGAHLEVLGYPHIVQLALAGGLVDRVQSIEARALAGFFAKNGELEPDLKDYFSDFDLIVSYLYDPDGIFQANVARCSVAQFLIGPHRPNEAELMPAAQVYLKPLERLAIFDADPLPRLTLDMFMGTKNQLAVHPGSGGEHKNWPETQWMKLLQRLMGNTTVKLLLVGGEAEGHRLERLAGALPSQRVFLAQSLPLPDLARRLQLECLGFIGHDSGISHLAAALGLPGIVLWADTVEAIWRPPHPHVIVVNGLGGIASIGVDQVLRELELLIESNTGTRYTL
jgi:heptosyltransferase III